MLFILLKKWDENKEILKENLKSIDNIRDISYPDLVKLAFSSIYNNGNPVTERSYEKLNCESITEIDNGDYQGTLLYLIPFDTYQPNETEYLMTYVGYGSCSGCDALLSITDSYPLSDKDTMVNDLLSICKDIITNTIKPYNYGWRHSYLFETVEVADEKREEV